MSSLPLFGRFPATRGFSPPVPPNTAASSPPSTSSSGLCALSVLSASDRVVVFLIAVALVWLSGLVLYLNAAPASPLAQHAHHNVRVNPPSLQALQAAGEEADSPFSDVLPASASVALPSPPVSGVPVQPSWSYLPNAAVVVLTYNRPTYLSQALDALQRCEGFEHFRLYVSQDGSSPDLTGLVARYPNSTLLHRQREPLLSPTQGGTAYLAQHYKHAFDELFLKRGHSHVVVVEDDMLVSPDFFILFRDTAPLLDSDPSVFCVSSWHDNGRRGLVYDPYRLFRTSYFPGLGWMMKAALWDELHPIFPLDQWDHFMRLDTTHKGRSCIVPEVSRNKNIGEQGTNMGGSFFSRFLEPIAWQQTPVPTFYRADDSAPLAHLRQPRYDERLRAELEAAEVLGHAAEPEVRQRLSALREGKGEGGKATLAVYRREEYHHLTQLFSLLPVPRSTHGGVSALRVAAQPRPVEAPQLGDGPAAAGDDSHWLYFVDVRAVNFSRHLPSWLSPSSPHHRLVWQPHPQLHVATSQASESCDSACARLSPSPMRCSADHFSLLNSCSALHRHFPCERGCVGGVQGLDVPNYVVAAEKPECFHQCLTTEDTPECSASHWSAQRVCPCTPSGQG